MNERSSNHRAWRGRDSALAVCLASLATILTLSPDLILTANTPTGGDFGAHVLAPAHMRDVLLPQGRVMGWSNDWFAGFPIFYFYFPAPALATVALDILLPYGVALKLVSVAGLIALAPATYFFVRSLGFDRPVSAIAAVAGASYVFMETPWPNIYGGTIAATLAGEFSYSWAFALGFLYLGCLARALDRPSARRTVSAAALLGLTALCHVIPTIWLVLVSAVMGAAKWQRGWLARVWAVVAGIWVLAFAMAGFWTLPLVALLGYTSEVGHEPLEGLRWLIPVEFWPIAILGITGIVVATCRSARRAAPLVAMTVLPVAAFFVLEQGAKLWNGRLLPYWFFGMHVMAGLAVGHLAGVLVRRLPARWVAGRATWVVGVATVILVVMMVDIGGGQPGAAREGATLAPSWLGGEGGPVEWMAERITLLDFLVLDLAFFGVWLLGRHTVKTGVLVPFAAGALFVGVVFVGVLTGENYVTKWARLNYGGYEGVEHWDEYRTLMGAVAALPPGRVQWEATRDLRRYGTEISQLLVPYWTSGSHSLADGLFYESSTSTPFHYLNEAEVSTKPSHRIRRLNYRDQDFSRGAAHMRLFNMGHYIAYTDEAKLEADAHPDFQRVGDSGPWTIYSLPPSSLVDVADHTPWVFGDVPRSLPEVLAGILRDRTSAGFDDLALAWYDDLGMLDQWIAADGPTEWQRVGADMAGVRESLPETTAAVSDVTLDHDRISFRTTAIGMPHMVKVSYFPNWVAVGAQGPWRVTPSFMLVVPTQEHVSIYFTRSGVEMAGIGLSAVSITASALWAAAAWEPRLARRNRRSAGRLLGGGVRPGSA